LQQSHDLGTSFVTSKLAYGIGIPEPLSVYVNSYGTVIPELDDYQLSRIVNDYFDLRPGMIIKELHLKRPIYKKTSYQGHFGRSDPDFTWEQAKVIDWKAWKSQ
jgi:S-adenosylmethionine synthetase